MKGRNRSQATLHSDNPKITISTDGPYLVTGGIPLVSLTIRTDLEGHCRNWVEGDVYPSKDRYALCRCGHSQNLPFCDGTHATIEFNGTETARRDLFLDLAEDTEGPTLSLSDVPDLCVHARFCLRAGGIWDLISHSDQPEARKVAIEIAGNCPGGRLVVRDKTTGRAIEPFYKPSIGIIEYPVQRWIGPLWVRGNILVESANGTRYETRNRVTLCRCGRSSNKPFCDRSHRSGREH